MSDLVLTIRVPETLIARANAAGIEINAQLEAQTNKLLQTLEDEVRRAEASQTLLAFMRAAAELPDYDKPSPEEIDAEIRAYYAERHSQLH